MKLEFSLQSFRNYSNFMKIRQAAAVFFQADGETGTTKLIIAFRIFPNPPENPYFCPVCLCHSHDSQSQSQLHH